MKSGVRVALQPAYVLHQYDWRETSRIVEILSRDHGRLGLVARGARRPRSPLRAVLRPFQPLLLSWTGGGDLVTLTGVEPADAPFALQGQALLSAFYLNELLLRLLTRHDPQAELHARYAETLRSLAGDINASLRLFEKHLLEILGYGLTLDHEAETGRPIEAGALYRYHLERGAMRVAAGGGMGVQVSGDTLLALAAESLTGREQLREARRLLQAALERHLGGRPLKTREVLRAFGKAAG